MGKVISDYRDFVEQMTDLAIESIEKINESSRLHVTKDKEY